MPTNNAINVTAAGLVKYDGAGAFAGVTTTNHNALVGAASNGITSVAPSATSGVPLISQGASSDPAFGTAVVAGGGTGVTSTTAYAVLTGGTTSTGPFQSIASVGTSGQVLTSNGAGALPTFQAAGSTGILVSKTTLTSAQVKALTTTPIQLVATPGANKMIYVLGVSFKLVYGGTNAFTVAGASLPIRYVNNSGQTSLFNQTTTGAGWLDQTANTTSQQAPTGTVQNAATTSFENQALFMCNNGSAVAGNAAGNNSVIVQVMYAILDFT